MNEDFLKIVQTLQLPKSDSHKGQNGRLLVIGGSKLFHAASLWSLTVASRIVDLVHYCSVPENNALVHELKKEFRNGIVIERSAVYDYIAEDDCILIGPGMTRDADTESLTNELLKKYPDKQWVIDAGALQMVDPNLIPRNAVLTPHTQEFDLLLRRANIAKCHPALDAGSYKIPGQARYDKTDEILIQVKQFSNKHDCIVLLKGQEDIASNGKETKIISGGNAGMTKGGTGDVLAGLVAALCCNNDPWTATCAGSYINKQAGEDLFSRVGPFFNATDLANQIPQTMQRILTE